REEGRGGDADQGDRGDDPGLAPSDPGVLAKCPRFLTVGQIGFGPLARRRSVVRDGTTSPPRAPLRLVPVPLQIRAVCRVPVAPMSHSSGTSGAVSGRT